MNGKSRPPRQAVAVLGQLAGADPVRLLALWELADQAPGAHPPPPDATPDAALDATPADEPADVVRSGRRRWPLVVAAAVGAAVGAGLTGWLTLGVAPTPPMPTPVGQAKVSPAGYACHVGRHDDRRLYAGYSTTSSRLVALNGGSPDVIEVQCLLVHHGFDPGRVDGLFGPHTEQAVKLFQTATGAVVDGIVGPQTWALLRS